MHQRIFLIVRLFKISFKIRLTLSKEIFDDCIVLNDVDVKSQIEYLSEYGALMSHESSEEKMSSKVLIGTNRGVSLVRKGYSQELSGKLSSVKSADTLDGKQSSISDAKFLIVDQTDESSDSLDTSNKKRSADTGNAPMYRKSKFLNSSKPPLLDSSVKNPSEASEHVIKTLWNRDHGDIGKDENVPLRFSVSKINFYVLKYILSPQSRPRIVMDYTEVENPPITLQVFLHLPLLITSIIVVVLVMTFETDIDKNLIAKEISKLPLQKYTDSLEFQECPICLDLFFQGDEVRILSCKHCFHKNCIDSWLVNLLKCPLCRNSVTKLADSPSYEIYQTITNL